jgi:beta-phosphoglucomutase-like phosphatase (HAD superfamily)
MEISITIPGLGFMPFDSGFMTLQKSSDNIFAEGESGVVSILATGDRKVEFITFEKSTLARVNSSMGYPAYYPVHPVQIQKPIRGVLMDLDGTTVHSEEFWMSIIQMSIASLLGNPNFTLEEADKPFVSGHSVSEHLKYGIQKYCPERTLEEARSYYFAHTHRELDEIMQGRGQSGAFKPALGVKDFLLELKQRDIKIGLVTSGLYEKAWPEILSAFKTMDMGDPYDFYDVIISAGYPLKKGSVGTLDELSPKPHPWLYAEAFRVGLGIEFEDRNSIIGIEDSGAGICSVRLAGIPAIGLVGGNIVESGCRFLCNHYCQDFRQILNIID